jgi:hypothetical protein
MFPNRTEDYVEADSLVRLFDAFVESLDMDVLDFVGASKILKDVPVMTRVTCCVYTFMAISMRSVLPEGSNVSVNAT